MPERELFLRQKWEKQLLVISEVSPAFFFLQVPECCLFGNLLRTIECGTWVLLALQGWDRLLREGEKFSLWDIIQATTMVGLNALHSSSHQSQGKDLKEDFLPISPGHESLNHTQELHELSAFRMNGLPNDWRGHMSCPEASPTEWGSSASVCLARCRMTALEVHGSLFKGCRRVSHWWDLMLVHGPYDRSDRKQIRSCAQFNHFYWVLSLWFFQIFSGTFCGLPFILLLPSALSFKQGI